MENTAQQPPAQEKFKRIDVAKLKKTGAVVLPSMFTIANMAFGFFSVLMASEAKYVQAAWFIVASYFMDMLDGRVARLVHGESSFGVEIDSLSDWISFGTAPAFLVYKLVLKDYGVWGYPVAFLYVLCAALRLARFNVKSHFGGGSKDYFQGLPTPGAAGVMISFVLAYTMLETDGGTRSIPFVSALMPYVYAGIPFIVVALALLMVSNAPYAAFKGDKAKLNSIQGVLLVTAVLSLIVAYPQDALFVFFSVYALSGVIAGLYETFLKLFRPAQAPQR